MGVAVLAWVATVILTDTRPITRSDATPGAGAVRIASPVIPSPIADQTVVSVTAAGNVTATPTGRP